MGNDLLDPETGEQHTHALIHTGKKARAKIKSVLFQVVENSWCLQENTQTEN
jgi:hypothetical protein